MIKTSQSNNDITEIISHEMNYEIIFLLFALWIACDLYYTLNPLFSSKISHIVFPFKQTLSGCGLINYSLYSYTTMHQVLRVVFLEFKVACDTVWKP